MCYFLLIYSRYMKVWEKRKHLSEDALWNFLENDHNSQWHNVAGSIFVYINTCKKMIDLFNQSMNFDEIYSIDSCDGPTYNEMLFDSMIPLFIETWRWRGMWLLSIPIEQCTILLISRLIFIVKSVYAHKISLIYLRWLLKLRKDKNLSSMAFLLYSNIFKSILTIDDERF